ncbi:MAG: 30S ribosomal protein S5 [Holosporaceae bacterium]|jgi:small subunit ribosomal protein S5|nr:30S ribosomal protein S5 [Holosporaceae bacterium]
MSREEVAYVEKLVAINRVAKVVKGGKRFSFSALVVVGDGRGRVGYASGKAREVADAVKKASERAKRSMIRIPMREGRTLHHDSFGRFGAGKVVLRSAVSGTGIIAGGAMRSVFEALGVQDVVSKCIGTANPHNMVRATFDALQSTMSPKYIANKRGKRVGDITSRRTLGK